MAISFFSSALARAKTLPAFVRFGLVGGTGLMTDISAFTFFSALEINPFISRLDSLAVATLVTWTLNRHFTFDRQERQVSNEVSRYVTVTLIAQGISYAVFVSLITIFPYFIHQLALIAGAVVAAVFSFNGHKFVSFGPLIRRVS